MAGKGFMEQIGPQNNKGQVAILTCRKPVECNFHNEFPGWTWLAENYGDAIERPWKQKKTCSQHGCYSAWPSEDSKDGWPRGSGLALIVMTPHSVSESNPCSDRDAEKGCCNTSASISRGDLFSPFIEIYFHLLRWLYTEEREIPKTFLGMLGLVSKLILIP